MSFKEETMTIEKAIAVLRDMGTPNFKGSTEEILQARKLGTEALKWIYALRGIVKSLPPHKLPGETK